VISFSILKSVRAYKVISFPILKKMFGGQKAKYRVGKNNIVSKPPTFSSTSSSSVGGKAHPCFPSHSIEDVIASKKQLINVLVGSAEYGKLLNAIALGDSTNLLLYVCKSYNSKMLGKVSDFDLLTYETDWSEVIQKICEQLTKIPALSIAISRGNSSAKMYIYVN
jgi:hypothetical protein